MTKQNARQKMRDLEDRYSASAHAPTATRLNGASGHNSNNPRLAQSAHTPDINKIRVNRPGMTKQGSARPGMIKQGSARPGMARVASARPAMTKQASARPGMAKQASARPGMAKQASARPGLAKAASTPVMAKQASTKAALKKEKSVKASLKKGKSKKALTKEKSKKELKKEKSKKELKKENSKKAELLTKQPSRGGGDLNRTPSAAGRLGGMNRTPSRGNLERAPSRGDLKRQGTQQSFKQQQRPSMSRSPSARSNATLQQQQNYRGRQRWQKFKKMEEKPKRSLVVIWLVVLAELSFDLGTTIIAFRAMLNDDDCCGYELELGNLPLSVATPFIFLICLELLILLRAMVLTMWPSILDRKEKEHNEDGTERNGGWRLAGCNFFRLTVKTLLKGINVLVLLNPFFGCIIAWMLLYQSDKDESFLVLGLEGGSIILHFISVKLEGSVQNFRQFLFHCMPLIPFIASVTLVLVYLKQEGVCYVVERSVFLFQGCELCPNGFPPIDGNCILDNGTVVAITDGGFLNIGDSLLNNPGELTRATANQGTFCAADHEGWNTNFCFFNYDGDD